MDSSKCGEDKDSEAEEYVQKSVECGKKIVEMENKKE